jgi:hypothetical protein
MHEYDLSKNFESNLESCKRKIREQFGVSGKVVFTKQVPRFDDCPEGSIPL